MPPITMPTLALENVEAFMRKISINVPDKKADNTVFTLPFEGIALTPEQLDAYLGPYTHRSWFNQDAKTKLWSPMPWVGRLPKGEIVLEDEFEADGAEIIVSGGTELVFEADEEDDEDEDEESAPAKIRVTTIVLKPTPGGVTLLSFHLQVRPGLGDENLALQEHQYRKVQVTLGNTRLAARKAKQQELPLAQGSDNGNGEHKSEDEQAAETQVAAATAAPGQVIDGRSERVKESDRKRGSTAH